MTEEIINDDGQEPEIPADAGTETEKPTRPANRFKDLSDKVELTAKERDEANTAKLAAEKELDFYKTFSKISSKPEYQFASEFQDKIKEKVLSGYDMEDATISVLGKAGKLGNFTPPLKRDSPVGGSAVNSMVGGAEKSAAEMTQAERRQALIDSDLQEPGSLSKTLRELKYNG